MNCPDQRGNWRNKKEISLLHSVAYYYTEKAMCRMVNIAHYGCPLTSSYCTTCFQRSPEKNMPFHAKAMALSVNFTR